MSFWCPVDIRKLEIFESVARHKNFSRAAEELHMAQPAVSIAVRKLEEELENPLLERTGRSIRLTAEGRETLQRARDILSQVRELKVHIQDMNDLSHGQLTIACPSILATYFLPDLLSDFLRLYPGVKALVTQAGTRNIEKMLLEDEIEIGVIIVDDAPAELDIIPLLSEHLVVCVDNRHPWIKRKTISVQELNGKAMALYKTGYYVRQQLDHQVNPDIRLETDFLPLINRAIKQRLGISVALGMMAAQEPGIKGISLNPRVRFQMGIAKRRGRPVSRANRAFLEWLKQRAIAMK